MGFAALYPSYGPGLFRPLVANLKLAVAQLAPERDILRSGNGRSPHLGGHGHEAFLTLRCESDCLHLVDCTVHVRPKRHSSVVRRNTLGRRHHLASQRRGRSAEASSQATEAARGCP
jgi:hypothetical protein